jgi:hypothetical protein
MSKNKEELNAAVDKFRKAAKEFRKAAKEFENTIEALKTGHPITEVHLICSAQISGVGIGEKTDGFSLVYGNRSRVAVGFYNLFEAPATRVCASQAIMQREVNRKLKTK